MQNIKSLCSKITKLLIIIIFLLPSIKTMEEINLQTIQAVSLKSDKNIRKKYLFKVLAGVGNRVSVYAKPTYLYKKAEMSLSTKLYKVFVVKKKNKLVWYKIGKNQWIMAIDTDKPLLLVSATNTFPIYKKNLNIKTIGIPGKDIRIFRTIGQYTFVYKANITNGQYVYSKIGVFC